MVALLTKPTAETSRFVVMIEMKANAATTRRRAAAAFAFFRLCASRIRKTLAFAHVISLIVALLPKSILLPGFYSPAFAAAACFPRNAPLRYMTILARPASKEVFETSRLRFDKTNYLQMLYLLGSDNANTEFLISDRFTGNRIQAKRHQIIIRVVCLNYADRESVELLLSVELHYG